MHRYAHPPGATDTARTFPRPLLPDDALVRLDAHDADGIICVMPDRPPSLSSLIRSSGVTIRRLPNTRSRNISVRAISNHSRASRQTNHASTYLGLSDIDTALVRGLPRLGPAKGTDAASQAASDWSPLWAKSANRSWRASRPSRILTGAVSGHYLAGVLSGPDRNNPRSIQAPLYPLRAGL